jgi:hypothetical protein
VNTGGTTNKTFTAAKAQTITTPSTLFPYTYPYPVYAGTCPSNNPDPNGDGSNAAAIGNVTVPVGGAGNLSPNFILLPALHLTVRTGSSSSNPGSTVTGARVRITDTTCSPDVTRTFATNASAQLADSPTGATDPGLPYGTDYRICADANVNGTQRMNYVRIVNFFGSQIEDVPVDDPNAGTVRTIYLTGSGATSGSGAVCP